MAEEYSNSEYQQLNEATHLENVLLLSRLRKATSGPPNQIVPWDGPLFPAHLMSYPLLDPELPYSLNYGGAGWLLHQHSNSSSDLQSYLAKFDGWIGNTTSASLLPNFLGWSQAQVLIVWWTKIWVCGSERPGLTQHTPQTIARQANNQRMADIFKEHFHCDTSEFLFRRNRRPEFDINRFLSRKEQSKN